MGTDLRELCDDSQSYINDPNVEIQWATSAAQKAEIHTNLLIASDTRSIKLCKDERDIKSRFRESFPLMEVKEITLDDLKGQNRDKWRIFCMEFSNTVKDYNFGSLLRLSAAKGYSDENTVIIIFLAIEVTRNHEGVNEACKADFIRSRQTLLEEEANVL